jgi:hypothetical protein
MAKGRTKIIVRRVGGAVGRGVRRFGRAAREDKDILAAGVGGFIIGKLETGGSLASIPNITGDPVADLGILLYIANRWHMGGKWSRTGAISALSIAGYRKGTVGAVRGDEGVIG